MAVKLNELRADIGPILTTNDSYLSSLYLDLVTSESIDAFLNVSESPYLRGLKMRPDFVVAAEGSSFEIPHRSSPSFPGIGDVGYSNAASVFEVKREKTRGTDDENVLQLGYHCQ